MAGAVGRGRRGRRKACPYGFFLIRRCCLATAGGPWYYAGLAVCETLAVTAAVAARLLTEEKAFAAL